MVAAGVGGVVGLSIALAAVRAGGSTPPSPSTTVPTAVPLSVAPTTAPPTTAAPTTTTPRPTTTTAAAHPTPPTNPKGKGKARTDRLGTPAVAPYTFSVCSDASSRGARHA